MVHWTKTNAREETIRKIKEARTKQIFSEESKIKKGISLSKWHQENKETLKYKERGERISKGKSGVPRLDMIKNEFGIGQKPNRTSFKKGQTPWNKGTKGVMPNCWNKGLTKENSEKVNELSKRLSKIRKERIASGLIIIPKGSDNHSWLGGKSFEPYDCKFNKEFKNLVRLRDNFCCLNCGISEQTSIIIRNRKLSIHHIDYDKINSCLQNCVTLCTTCNNKANFNRDTWKEYFKNILISKYNYQYEPIKVEVTI